MPPQTPSAVSLANLRPGESPGRPAGPVYPAEHLARTLRNASPEELRSILRNSSASAYLQIAARLALQAIGHPLSKKKSDQVSIRAQREAASEVMDRTSGKARQTIETVQTDPPTTVALLARIRSQHALPDGMGAVLPQTPQVGPEKALEAESPPRPGMLDDTLYIPGTRKHRLRTDESFTLESRKRAVGEYVLESEKRMNQPVTVEVRKMSREEIRRKAKLVGFCDRCVRRLYDFLPALSHSSGQKDPGQDSGQDSSSPPESPSPPES